MDYFTKSKLLLSPEEKHKLENIDGTVRYLHNKSIYGECLEKDEFNPLVKVPDDIIDLSLLYQQSPLRKKETHRFPVPKADISGKMFKSIFGEYKLEEDVCSGSDKLANHLCFLEREVKGNNVYFNVVVYWNISDKLLSK